MTARIRCSLFLGTLGLIATAWAVQAADPVPQPASPSKEKPAESASQASLNPAIKPKPLAEKTVKGLTYLVNQQDSATGGWGQRGGWRQASSGGGRVEGNDVKDPPDVGNTCAATLALIRSGSTPKEGLYAKNINKGFDFICEQVEKADSDSLYVTDIRDTQLQVKIGTYVDTFLAALVLSELKGQMASPKDEVRLAAALKKTIGKIERNQKQDGTFAGNNGWASVLSQSLCTKGLNRAAQKGVAVKKETLDRDFGQAVASLDAKSGQFKTTREMSVAGVGGVGAGGAGVGFGARSTRVPAVAATGGVKVAASAPPAAGGTASAAPSVAAPAIPAASAAPSDAGVPLYAAANAGRIQEQANTNIQVEKHAKEVLADGKASARTKQDASDDLTRVAKVAQANKASVEGLIRRLDDKQFLAGFGNNGGEEFLSYMTLSETLLAKGGTDWLAWDKAISENLHRVQNQDGSWSGQHCITGRSFTSAAALLTLMADRAPLPIADQVKGAKQAAK